MVDITILERDAFNIKLNTDTCVFNVNLIADMEYNDEGFQEFLEYFKYIIITYCITNQIKSLK